MRLRLVIRYVSQASINVHPCRLLCSYVGHRPRFRARHQKMAQVTSRQTRIVAPGLPPTPLLASVPTPAQNPPKNPPDGTKAAKTGFRGRTLLRLSHYRDVYVNGSKYLDRNWILESISLLLAILPFIAIIITLTLHQNKPLTNGHLRSQSTRCCQFLLLS